MLGRLDFAGDVRVGPNYFTDDDRPGSDSKAAEEFLRAKGFNIDGHVRHPAHVPPPRRHQAQGAHDHLWRGPPRQREQRIKSEITAHAGEHQIP